MIDKEKIREEFSKRLNTALDNAGVREHGRGVDIQNELKKRGLKASTESIRKWLSGLSIPGVDNMRALADFTNVSVAWLQFGEGEVNSSQNNLSSNNHSNIKPLNSESAKMFSYPVIEWDDIENFIDRRLSPTKFRSIVVSTKNIDNGFWLEVTDDLMSCLSSPSFPSGSLILVDPNINKIENGKFLLIEHKDEKLFRQIVKNSGTTYLKTLNDKYLPVPINDNECKVLGKIVGLFIEILD